MEDEVQVLHERDVPGGDPNWPVSIRVERRKMKAWDGKEKTYVNLLVSVGTKKLIIPRRASAAVAAALSELSVLAQGEYVRLLEEQNK